ncbi:MAG: aldehyde dehydrogenase family protein [Proteobacteria bacterium]|nr:MAG: aldehyde dehydrogenase family protein [Pseudomonadota bacterium]
MGIETFSAAVNARKFPLDFPGHFIGGEWVNEAKSEALQGSFNPSRGEPIGKIHLGRKTIETAIDAADLAQKAIFGTSLEERIVSLTRLRAQIADYEGLVVDAMCLEAGKPRWEAQADFRASIQQLDAILAEKDRIRQYLLGPVMLAWPGTDFELRSNGITMAFLPFSTPLATFVQCLAGAVIAGSPLILMPSSHAVLSGILFAHIVEKLELPRGSVNIVFGNYQTFQKSLSDKRIQAVIYSGSREHCDAIRRDYAGALSRELLLQSGGKNAVIVAKDSDVKEAVRQTVYGVIKNAGQLNTSTSRAYVHDSMIEAFKEEIVRTVRNLSIGPTDGKENPHLGPLYAQKAVDKFLRYQTMAKREATDTWVWGKSFSTGTSGYFVSPGIHFFDELSQASSYQANVLMTPDVSVYRYKDVEEAIAATNDTEASLVTSLFGAAETVKPWVPHLKSPNVLINLPTVGLDVFLPVAGRKLCGDYRLNGLGIAFLLTYPQAIKVGHSDGHEFHAWPALD